MPKDCQLEVSDSMDGPWRTIKTFSVSCEAPLSEVSCVCVYDMMCVCVCV